MERIGYGKDRVWTGKRSRAISKTHARLGGKAPQTPQQDVLGPHKMNAKSWQKHSPQKHSKVPQCRIVVATQNKAFSTNANSHPHAHTTRTISIYKVHITCPLHDRGKKITHLFFFSFHSPQPMHISSCNII